MKEIKISVNDEDLIVNLGTKLSDLAKEYGNDIIIAKVNNDYVELDNYVKENDIIYLYDLHEKEANRIYLNSLIFLMDYTAKKVFNANLKVNHSLDKGLYISTDKKIDENKLIKVEEELRKIVEKDLKIERITTSRASTYDYYKSVGKTEKYENLIYNTNSYLTMYKIDDYYDYFYSAMVPSTGCLKYFKLNLINDHGFVLTFPTIYMTDSIKAYEHREKVFNMFKESRELANKLGIKYVNDVNKIISQGKVKDLILIEEIVKNTKILNVADKILKNKEVKIVLLAGPSSSGKTTTTNKLCLALKSKGKNPIMISMDNFFKDRVDTPLDKFGNKDYECLEAVNLKLFNEKISSLLKGKETLMPEFNFITGEKEYKENMIMGENDILLIEGIHAMNPKILDKIDSNKKVKIYLSALIDLDIDRDVRISTTDNRLLRRMVRDHRTRGYSVVDTLAIWDKVRDGEEKYIFPYQDMADYTINTGLTYELGVLKVYVEPLLYSVQPTSPYYSEAKRLINFLRLFLPMPSENVPHDSIIREFIGGGSFKI